LSDIERAKQILLHDLDPNFLESLAKAIAWEYSSLYETLARDESLIDACRDELFNRRRGDCGMRALGQSARKHGVPFQFQRLSCNGQYKLLVKAGRVILIQEPASFSGHPSAADYKKDLAGLHGFVRQLELELGDQPGRIYDWSGSVLAVLLHGSAGRKFARDDKALGSLMLGLPDAAYQQWIMRIDLLTVAMFGRAEGVAIDEGIARETLQKDNVVVTPKRRNSERDTA
jgi:hypothetical protein